MPADGNQGCYCVKRRLRYVTDFWAALGQAIACLSFICGVRRAKNKAGQEIRYYWSEPTIASSGGPSV